MDAVIQGRSSHQRCSVKKVFFEISQNSQEKTCARVSFLINFIKTLITLTLLKTRLRCFPVNFVKFLRTPFSIEHLWWLLLIEFFCYQISHLCFCNGLYWMWSLFCTFGCFLQVVLFVCALKMEIFADFNFCESK